jgi:hypothetical protein
LDRDPEGPVGEGVETWRGCAAGDSKGESVAALKTMVERMRERAARRRALAERRAREKRVLDDHSRTPRDDRGGECRASRDLAAAVPTTAARRFSTEPADAEKRTKESTSTNPFAFSSPSGSLESNPGRTPNAPGSSRKRPRVFPSAFEARKTSKTRRPGSGKNVKVAKKKVRFAATLVSGVSSLPENENENENANANANANAKSASLRFSGKPPSVKRRKPLLDISRVRGNAVRGGARP